MDPYTVDIGTLTAVSKGVVLVLGGTITVLASRAADRTGSPALRLLAVGFGVITLGAFLGGGVYWLTDLDVHVAILVQSLLTAIGFVLLAYSLYATHIDTPDTDAPETDDRATI